MSSVMHATTSMQKGVADALIFEKAAATLLKSENLRPRIIASLRAATHGFRVLCADYEVGGSTVPNACRVRHFTWQQED